MNNMVAIGYCTLSRESDALPHFRRIVELQHQVGTPYKTAVALNNLGGVLSQLQQGAEAVVELRAALALLDGMPDVDGLRSGVLANLAVALELDGRDAEALPYHEHSLRIASEMRDDLGIAFAARNLGNAYHKLGRRDEAALYRRTALDHAVTAGDRLLEVAVHVELGNALVDDGKAAEASLHLAAAERIYPDAPEDIVGELRRRLEPQ
jgi:tetratricopeptide (TPR) repeat protein